MNTEIIIEVEAFDTHQAGTLFTVTVERSSKAFRRATTANNLDNLWVRIGDLPEPDYYFRLDQFLNYRDYTWWCDLCNVQPISTGHYVTLANQVKAAWQVLKDQNEQLIAA